MAKKSKEEVYEQLTGRILEKMKAGVCPWKQPWKEKLHAGQPRNLVTGRPYRGYNWFFLLILGFEDPQFLTFKQAKDKGGRVKPGEHGFPICFWSILEREVEGEKEKIPLLRTYYVFNVEQCENLKLKVKPEAPEVDFDPLAEAESIWEGMPKPPTLKYGGSRACYSISADRIQMPKRSAFPTAEGFYETLFHEMGHATGHESRLNRKELGGYSGGQDYSLEELTAELTSAFLCAQAGLESTLDNHAGYLKFWMKALQDDPKMFVTASGKAQKAADYILNTTFEEKED